MARMLQCFLAVAFSLAAIRVGDAGATPIDNKYAELGGVGFLGWLLDIERSAAGNGTFREFELGLIYWSQATGAHEVHGVIKDKWIELGREQSKLGYPTSDELALPSRGRVSHFQRGRIEWTQAGGPRVFMIPLAGGAVIGKIIAGKGVIGGLANPAKAPAGVAPKPHGGFSSPHSLGEGWGRSSYVCYDPAAASLHRLAILSVAFWWVSSLPVHLSSVRT